MQTIIHIIRDAPVAIGMAGQVAGAFSSVLLSTGASSPARSKFRTEEFNRLSSGGRDRREVIAGHDEVLDIQAAGLRPTGCFLCFLGEQGFSAMDQVHFPGARLDGSEHFRPRLAPNPNFEKTRWALCVRHKCGSHETLFRPGIKTLLPPVPL